MRQIVVLLVLGGSTQNFVIVTYWMPIDKPPRAIITLKVGNRDCALSIATWGALVVTRTYGTTTTFIEPSLPVTSMPFSVSSRPRVWVMKRSSGAEVLLRKERAVLNCIAG